MATAFHEEIEQAGVATASSEFLSQVARLSKTKHEHSLMGLLEECGLQVKVTISWLDVGLSRKHPVPRLQHFLKAMSGAGKISSVLLQNHSFADLETFWTRYRESRPNHPVFREHAHHLNRCLPLFLHADEGTGMKRKGLLILQFQPVLAQGSKRAADLNMAGSTYVNRFVHAVLKQSLYNKQKTILYNLLRHWSEDFRDAFRDGVFVSIGDCKEKIYPIVLGLKGDWQGIIKCGRLSRHFMRDAPSNASPAGICHLCQAGRAGFPWHHFRNNAEWLVDPHALDDEPWVHPSPLLLIPCDAGACFFMIDVFHTAHKGVIGDFVASAIAPCLSSLYFSTPVWHPRFMHPFYHFPPFYKFTWI